WIEQTGCERISGRDPEAPVGTRIEPAARLVHVDELARVGREVAAVGDHDPVARKARNELAVDARGMDRHRVALQIAGEPGALLLLDAPQLRDPVASIF